MPRSRRRSRRDEQRGGCPDRLRQPVRADAAARAGRHGDGARRHHRLRLSHRLCAGAEAGRPDHHAHGDGLFLRRDPDVPPDGRVRLGLRHQPRTVPRRQHLCRPLERRPRHRDHCRLRRLRGDLGLLGRDRRDILGRRLSGDAPLRLSAILCHRRDRGRRYAGRDAAAVHRARRLRHHHPAGYRKAVHRRHRAGTARDRDAHDHDRHHRRGPAEIPAGRPARLLAGARCWRCATSGRRCCCSCS